MSNFLRTATVLFLTATALFAQMQPYDPPSGPVHVIHPTLTFETSDIGLAVDLSFFENVSSRPGSGQTSWQIMISNLSGLGVILILDTRGWRETDKFYIRTLDPEGFKGPFSPRHLDQAGRLRTPAVFAERFVLEFLAQPDFPQHGDISIHMLGAIPGSPTVTLPMTELPPVRRDQHLRERPVLLLTGYWPPTNEMIRHFSQNELLNPGGWAGEDWEGRGYDIISYFPTFNPPDCDNCGPGSGDIMVDYQDTSQDFWPISTDADPMGIITFSRGAIDLSWELENNYYNRTNWYPDYIAPTLPTPNPPDGDQAAFYRRESSLPMEAIVEAVADAGLGLNPWIDWAGDPGMFVSEFMGYHGVWYKALQDSTATPCYVAGHVHVGGLIDWSTAREAAEETIRVVTAYMDQFFYTPGDVNDDGQMTVQDLVMIVNILLGILEPTQAEIYAADVNEDGEVTVQDIVLFVTILLDE